MMTRLAPLFLFVLAVGCGTSTAVVEPFEDGVPFDLVQGQTAVSADGRTSFTFARVLTDSRCPATVVCIWQGEARVELEVHTMIGAPTELQETVASVAPTPVDVLVGSPEPVVVAYRQVRALELTPQSSSASRSPAIPRVRLLVSAILPPASY